MYSIAIDGPVCSGKSTIAHAISERLNILHLNTGDLYRAIGYYAYKNNIASTVDSAGMPQLNADDMKALINDVDVDVKFIDGTQHTFVNGEDVTDQLHTPIMSDYSSRVSAIPEVRNHILQLQRDVALKNNVVMEGRDITSHVLPNSKYKFYITARPEVRAQRRMEQDKLKGMQVTYDEVLADIILRDKRDMTRKICPLVITKDAVVIDTSDKTLEQVLDEIIGYIEER